MVSIAYKLVSLKFCNFFLHVYLIARPATYMSA